MGTKEFKFLDFKAWPMNELESALDDAEPAWADFAFALRPQSPGRPHRRVKDGSWKMQGLGTIVNLLNSYKARLQDGDRSAIYDALMCCAMENVPMPYWLSTAILDVGETLMREPADGQHPKNLHALFGLEERFPESPTKSIKAKRDLQLRAKLYQKVHELKNGEGLSTDKAIERARAELRFPYSQRKARELFDLQETIQRAHLDATRGIRRHRVR